MKPTPTPAPVSSLAMLNAHIAQAAQAAREAQGLAAPHGQAPWPPLRSAQRFRETWERLGAELQVQQARQRAPQNAGPLNPQRLMVETLARMGELSPHYLRRFLAHTETLLWLEQAQGQPKAGSSGKPAASGAARAGRSRR
ncbi:MAG TPA: DUF2894 domain-containing protein [Hydrogenophaga sp.]|uniref:DUF2894 domain-containing protein n=1 Tax=Hydrogenophaga sp. TaxID=1904254 RepID=UPI002C249332|nr:DUF2894 domain-containing protein [Hydrogenophaga sp.]HMN91737.1 DUF2894 domain-containing protein [Hydrogenophaga sp.]HMP10546.1 DUF2894 domain-containing protein [Hydrogenophaga sp.]